MTKSRGRRASPSTAPSCRARQDSTLRKCHAGLNVGGFRAPQARVLRLILAEAKLAPEALAPSASTTVITAIFLVKCRRCRTPVRPGDALHIRDGKPGGLCSRCARGGR